MREFAIARRIAAPIDEVWYLLADSGDIQRWNPGVAGSSLTSDGPANDGGTDLTLHDSYSLNRLGRPARSSTDKQHRRGLGGLVDALQQESESIATRT